jgi:hypothetical protein|tara:strand:+ start:11722 stop:11991 length:270 start_codon:yes stop_codon:yes gene_type:complete
MIEASVSGLFRMILIILGVFVLLRFIGQILIAKNNIASQNEMKRREEASAKEKVNAMKNVGKTKILRDKQNKDSDDPIIDIDYTDIKDS